MQGPGCHADRLVSPMGLGGGGRLQHLGPERRAPLPPKQEGGPRQQQHKPAEAAGDAVGQALDRRLAGLGLLHEGNDAGHGAVRAAAQHLQGEGCLQVEAAGRQFAAGPGLQGQGFTREAGRIHGRAALQHQAIDGHPVTGQEQHPILGAQSAHPHGPRRPVSEHQQGRVGLQGGQLLEGAAGAEAGPLLDEAAQQHKAQQHHRLIEKTLPAQGGHQQGHGAGQVGTAHAQAHQGVHARQALEGPHQAAHQDRPTRQGQGQGRHPGVEPDIGQQGQGQVARLAQVAQHRHQQQAQGHHQPAPLLPPALLALALGPA